MADPTADWSAVDDHEDVDRFTDYLATLTGAEAVRGYKRRSHRLLDLRAGDRVLDVGCGRGDDALMLAEAVGPGGEVVGVDNSETMVEQARERAAEVPAAFAVEDALDLPFADDDFDAARADRVLQHLDAPDEALAELRRVTRPGGRVGVSDPDWVTAIVDTDTGHTDRFLSVEYACPRAPTRGRQLYRLATDGGLVDVDVDTWTLTSTDLAFIEEVGGLAAWTESMVAAGEVTEAEVEEWYEGLGAADERGSFFSSITGFTVVGTVPGE
ncbi:hypothetical protein BRD00_09040 [Halobacteriales archaeon QS_8_69_26]|nr:MAG: hypothetical protein BRD00_09040 [Halobacteriales archaeon QS_8_69_26]